MGSGHIHGQIWRYKLHVVAIHDGDDVKAKKLWGLIDKTEVKLDEIDVVTTTTFVKKENEAHNLLVYILFDN